MARVLSGHQGLNYSTQAPVAIYGRICPDILVAILGVLASPLHNQRDVGVVKGVAYLPVDPSSGVNQWKLQEFGVELVVIEISVLEVSERN